MHTMCKSGKRRDATKLSTIRYFVCGLIAPDLAPSQSTLRAHWRQLPIKGRGLFHAYDVQIRKAMLRSCQRFGTLSVGNLNGPDLAPSLSTPRAHWRQLPIKGRGLFHAYDVHIRKATLRSCQRFGTLCCIKLALQPFPTKSTLQTASSPWQGFIRSCKCTICDLKHQMQMCRTLFASLFAHFSSDMA